MASGAAPPRIVIYGVGQYGAMIARLAADRGWPIVAAFNRAGPKVGQDLGRVAGLDRDLGVAIQDSASGDYAGLDANLGGVTHRDLLSANIDAYRRLMGQYHPDRVAGAAPDLQKLAETKSREINAAYDRIQKLRKK